MTRINCIPVSELCDKHLIAEYRELPRVFKLARQSYLMEKIPQSYTLGTGHVKFFYDKLLFLYNRQHDITNEMLKRNFKPQFNADTLIVWKNTKEKLWGDWHPSEVDMAINRERISQRLSKMITALDQ